MLRRGMPGLLSGTVLCAVSVPEATAATTSVKQAILAQDQILNHAPGFTIVLNETKYKDSQYTTIAPKVAALTPVLIHAAKVVSAASATTTKEAGGQKDWVAGAREEAQAFGYLSRELIDVAHHDTGAADQAKTTGARYFKSAEKLAGAGDKLLGLPASA